MDEVTLASDGVPLIKFFAAFVLVVAAMFALAWILKRAGLAGPIIKMGAKRRLKVVESIAVDHRRRLVLVRRDDREHLVLLGPDHASVVETNILALVEPALSLSTQPVEEASRRDPS